MKKSLRGFKAALMWLTDPSPVSGPGLEMAWVVRPPETVKTGEVFNVTYSVTASDSFYRWAVDNHIFTHRWVHLTAGYTGFKLDRLNKRSSTEIFVGLNCVCVFSSIVTPEQARRFCEHHDCPANWKDANGENCCIHHANIHSCPLGYMVHTLGYFQLLHVHRCLLHSAANWQNKSLKKCNQNTLNKPTLRQQRASAVPGSLTTERSSHTPSRPPAGWPRPTGPPRYHTLYSGPVHLCSPTPLSQ